MRCLAALSLVLFAQEKRHCPIFIANHDECQVVHRAGGRVRRRRRPPHRARRGWHSNTALGDLFNFDSRVNRNGNGGSDISSRRNIAGASSRTLLASRRRLRDERRPEAGSERIRRRSEDVHSRLLRPVDERIQLGQVK